MPRCLTRDESGRCGRWFEPGVTIRPSDSRCGRQGCRARFEVVAVPDSLTIEPRMWGPVPQNIQGAGIVPRLVSPSNWRMISTRWVGSQGF